MHVLDVDADALQDGDDALPLLHGGTVHFDLPVCELTEHLLHFGTFRMLEDDLLAHRFLVELTGCLVCD